MSAPAVLLLTVAGVVFYGLVFDPKRWDAFWADPPTRWERARTKKARRRLTSRRARSLKP